MKKTLLRIALFTLIALIMAGGVDAKKKKKLRKPFFQETSAMNIDGGLVFLKTQSSTTLPVFLSAQMTVANNVSVGVQVLHFQYKHFLLDEEPNGHFTEWPEEHEEISYGHMLIALKAAYHLNDVFKSGLKINVPKKWDLYVALVAGYNIISASGTGTPTIEGEKKAPRIGISAGGRYLYSDRIGFFMDFGYSDYGYGSLGLSVLLGPVF